MLSNFSISPRAQGVVEKLWHTPKGSGWVTLVCEPGDCCIMAGLYCREWWEHEWASLPGKRYPATLTLQPSTLKPQPSTLTPHPSTLNPQPSTLNPQPSTFNPQPSTNLNFSTLKPQPYNLNLYIHTYPFTHSCTPGQVFSDVVICTSTEQSALAQNGCNTEVGVDYVLNAALILPVTHQNRFVI